MRTQDNQLEENFLVQKTNFNRIRNILLITDVLIDGGQESKKIILFLSMNYCIY